MSQSMGFQKLKNLVNSDVLRSLLLSTQVRKQIAEHGSLPNLLTEKRQFKGEYDLNILLVKVELLWREVELFKK